MICAKYSIVLLLLFYLRACSGNNSDPCLNPANQNLVVPFRETVRTDTFFGGAITIGGFVNLTDATNCYTLSINAFSVSNINYGYSNTSYAYLIGYFNDYCHGSPELYLNSNIEPSSATPLKYSSTSLQSLTIDPLYMHGTLTDNVNSWNVSLDIGASYFSSNISHPSTIYQLDEYVTYDDSPCTVRIRTDQDYTTTLYSTGFPITVHLPSGVSVFFHYPAGIQSAGSIYVTKKYYQQCTCNQSLLGAQSTSTEQYRFTPPNIAGIRTAASC